MGEFKEAGSFSFALKGNKGDKVHASISMIPLEIKGRFCFQGPQVANGAEGSAPIWVFEALKNDKDIEFIAIGKGKTGIIYTRMDE